MALNKLTTSVVLDVYDHGDPSVGIKTISCDSGSRYVRASLTYRRIPYKVESGSAVSLTVIRPDEAAVSITGEVTDGGGLIAELTDTATAIKGALLAQFKIEDGTQVLRTEIFKINNGEALDVTATEWAGDYQGYDLDELVNRIDNMGHIKTENNTLVIRTWK